MLILLVLIVIIFKQIESSIRVKVLIILNSLQKKFEDRLFKRISVYFEEFFNFGSVFILDENLFCIRI